MKWQRARVLPDAGAHPNFVAPGTLIWVKAERPRFRKGRVTANGQVFGAMAYDSNVPCPGCAGNFIVVQDHIELLPEFSDAEFPDEDKETRQ